MDWNERDYMLGGKTRRRVVQLAGSGSVLSLAGCSESGGSDEPRSQSQTTGKGAIESVRVDGTDLLVSLDESQPVESVQLYNPNDEVWSDGSLSGAAEHRVALFDDTGYEPGTHTVKVRDKQSELLGSATIDLVPDLEIVEFGLGRQYKEEIDFPNEAYSDRWKKLPVVEISNDGTGPDIVSSLTFNKISKRYDPQDIHGEQVIMPDSTTTVWSGSELFWGIGHPGPQYPCGQEVSVEITVEMIVAENRSASVTFTSAINENKVSEVRRSENRLLADYPCEVDGKLIEE
jgi:hypothetical protein